MFPRAPLPERIGAYSVLRRLPSTGGADRYLGREEGPRGFTRMVELKLAPAEDDPEVAAELAHEASVVARLNHPYITRMFNFLEHEGRLVLVLERVEGTTLARILSSARRRKQQFPDDAVFHVAHRLMSAIAHAHGMTDEDGQRTPVVHRAISPAALLVAWSGEVRLSGFGLAKIMGRSPDTAVGLVKGTPGYMAPEQLRGERITERADIYQAGLVIWEMLAGQAPPTPSSAPIAVPRSRAAGLVADESPELTSVSVLRPSVPREIAAVIDAMLEPAVDRRKISATEVERWLAKTVDVERGREALRERAITLRGQEARDAGASNEPVRSTSTTVRRAAPRGRGGGSGETLLESAPSRRSGGRAGLSTTSPEVPAAPRATPSSGVEITTMAEAATPLPAAAATPLPVGAVTPTPPVAAAATPPPVPARPAPGGFATSTLAAPPPGPGQPLPPPVDLSPFDSSPGLPFEPTPAMAAARVTMPDEVPTSGPRAMPLEGERSASTLITRLGRPRRTLLIGGVAGAVALLALGGAVVHRATSETAPSATASASSAAPAPPPPASTPSVVIVTPEVPALPELGPKQGALRVKTATPGNVYVNGALAGASDKILVVNCGQRYIRVGAASPVRGHTLWLGPGVSVKVACGVLTEVDAPQAR